MYSFDILQKTMQEVAESWKNLPEEEKQVSVIFENHSPLRNVACFILASYKLASG